MTVIKDLIAIGRKIVKTKAKINSIEDRILYCAAYAEITPIKDCAIKFRKDQRVLRKSLKKPKRQLFIFEMGYNYLLNKI